MPEPSNIDCHPSRNEAQIAFVKAIEALTGDPDVGPGQIAWLRRQRPVAIDVHDRVLLSYPSDLEARLARCSEAMVRVDNKLRANGIAAGLSFGVSIRRNAEPTQGVFTPQQTVPEPKRPPWDRKPVYLPSFLVATTLPHSDLKVSEFTRVNGKIRTTLHAPKRIGLPFGVHARLILIHLATGAVRTRSRRFAVGRSINELLARMSITNGGGRDGQSTRARNQLNRLCATTFTTTTLLGNQGENLGDRRPLDGEGPEGSRGDPRRAVLRAGHEVGRASRSGDRADAAPFAAGLGPVRLADLPDGDARQDRDSQLAGASGAVRLRVRTAPGFPCKIPESAGTRERGLAWAVERRSRREARCPGSGASLGRELDGAPEREARLAAAVCAGLVAHILQHPKFARADQFAPVWSRFFPLEISTSRLPRFAPVWSRPCAGLVARPAPV